MNYFAHGVRFLEDPYFLAGTAVPDWLSVVDRRVADQFQSGYSVRGRRLNRTGRRSPPVSSSTTGTTNGSIGRRLLWS